MESVVRGWYLIVDLDGSAHKSGSHAHPGG